MKTNHYSNNFCYIPTIKVHFSRTPIGRDNITRTWTSFTVSQQPRAQRETLCYGPVNNKTGRVFLQKNILETLTLQFYFKNLKFNIQCFFKGSQNSGLNNKRFFKIYLLFFFDSWYITKPLLILTYGNSMFCGPSKAMFPSALPRETLAVSGPQNILFPSVPVNKC